MSNATSTGTAGSTDIEVIEVEDARPHGTRVRGSAIWAGATVTLATFLLFEMLLLASDLSGTQVSVANPDTGSWVWDAAAAIVAFFIGGLVAGASVPYRSLETGALNGTVIWATAVTAIVLFTGIVGGAVFGALGDFLVSQQNNIQNAAQNAQATESMAEDARSAAGWAALGLILTLGAAAGGGALGSKMWPHPRQGDASSSTTPTTARR